MKRTDLTTVDHTLDEPREMGIGDEPITVTILWHPDVGRIGAQAVFPSARTTLLLDRNEPTFCDEHPLADQRISRAPLQLVPQPDDAFQVWPSRPGMRFILDGADGQGGERIGPGDLDRGVRLGLGRGALLLLSRGRAPGRDPGFGLVGASHDLARITMRIRALSARSEPVLITGASGTGKELMARALHRAGPRSGGPFNAVNLAALAPGTAPSQLFGHRRGAFTGADRSHPGFFAESDGGTLLLDEVGACPTDVQAQLLRVLENAEIQPVGGTVRRVDVRVVAATDSAIEARLNDEDFRAPLYFRLARSTLHIPPLRLRPADVAVQLVHFLRLALRERDLEHRLEPANALTVPWLGSDVMEAALGHSWPGNTRELIGVADRLADLYGDRTRCGIPEFIRIGQRPSMEAVPSPDAAVISGDASVEEVLQEHGYQLSAAARALGISVPTLRRRMAAQGIPRAQDLSREHIAAVTAEAGDLDQAANRLRVSAHALKLRMKALDIAD